MRRAKAMSRARPVQAPARFRWFHRPRSFEFLFRIHPNEHNIDNQIEEDDEPRVKKHRAQHHRVIAIESGVYEITPRPGIWKIVSTANEPVTSAAAVGPK